MDNILSWIGFCIILVIAASVFLVIFTIVKAISSFIKAGSVNKYKYSNITCIADSPEAYRCADGSMTLAMHYTIDGVEYVGTLDERFKKPNYEIEEIIAKEDSIYIHVNPDDMHRFCLHRDLEDGTAGKYVLSGAGKILVGVLGAFTAINIVFGISCIGFLIYFFYWLSTL